MLRQTSNLLKLARANRHLEPLVAIYYVTEYCNLNCTYCEDFGARRNQDKDPYLHLEKVKTILGMVRSGTDALMLTGGEPFTHPEIDQIIQFARQTLRFRELTLISNGLLLAQHEPTLANIDRLIISLDALDPAVLSKILHIPSGSAATILENVTTYAALQNKYQYRMILNAVLTPETLSGVEALIDFCQRHQLLISFSPQAANNWPRYDLTVSDAYQKLIETLIQRKHEGAPILGSDAYLQTLRAFQPYDCYPTLAPRIYSNGDLSYPCRPLEKAGNGQGGRTVNLLETRSWAEAWQTANQLYGQPPRTCHSCFQQCYAEPSFMQAQPMAMLYEWLRYKANRAGNLSTFAPG